MIRTLTNTSFSVRSSCTGTILWDFRTYNWHWWVNDGTYWCDLTWRQVDWGEITLSVECYIMNLNMSMDNFTLSYYNGTRNEDPFQDLRYRYGYLLLRCLQGSFTIIVNLLTVFAIQRYRKVFVILFGFLILQKTELWNSNCTNWWKHKFETVFAIQRYRKVFVILFGFLILQKTELWNSNCTNWWKHKFETVFATQRYRKVFIILFGFLILQKTELWNSNCTNWWKHKFETHTFSRYNSLLRYGFLNRTEF